MWREKASYLLHVILDDANKNNRSSDVASADVAPSIAGSVSGGVYPIPPQGQYSQGAQQ